MGQNMMRVVTMIAITIIMMMMIQLTDNGSGPNVWVGLRVTLILSLLCISNVWLSQKKNSICGNNFFNVGLYPINCVV